MKKNRLARIIARIILISLISTTFNFYFNYNNVYAYSADSYDISEYILESEHFIIDGSISSFLPAYVTPTTFNLFMSRMDASYDVMADLTGQTPYGGVKTTIIGDDLGNTNTIAMASGNRIYWNSYGNLLEERFAGISQNRADYWNLNPTTHELGHIFQSVSGSYWNFATEQWANYLARLAYEKCGANNWINSIDRALDRYLTDFKNMDINCSFYSGYDEYIMYMIHPIFNELGWESGWNALRAIIQSYYNGTYHGKSYKIESRYDREKMAAEFIERCSYFIGGDIKELWLPETMQRYRDQVIDKLIYQPQKPKIIMEININVNTLTIKDGVIAGDIEYNIVNNWDSQNADVVLCIYNSINQLVNFKIYDHAYINYGINQSKLLHINVPVVDSTSYSVKLFLWDSFVSLEPLAIPVDIHI